MRRNGWLMELTDGERGAIEELLRHEQDAHGFPRAVTEEQMVAFLMRVFARVGDGDVLPSRD